MIGLWLITIPFFGAIAAYIWGRYDLDTEFIPAVIFGILFWPLVLAIVIVFGPFVGLYALGQRKFEKKENTKDNTRKSK